MGSQLGGYQLGGMARLLCGGVVVVFGVLTGSRPIDAALESEKKKHCSKLAAGTSLHRSSLSSSSSCNRSSLARSDGGRDRIRDCSMRSSYPGSARGALTARVVAASPTATDGVETATSETIAAAQAALESRARSGAMLKQPRPHLTRGSRYVAAGPSRHRRGGRATSWLVLGVHGASRRTFALEGQRSDRT